MPSSLCTSARLTTGSASTRRRLFCFIHAFPASPKTPCDLLASPFPAIDRWRAPAHARSSAIRRCGAAPLVPGCAPREAATRPARAAGRHARASAAHSRASPGGRSVPPSCDVLRPADPPESGSSPLHRPAILESQATADTVEAPAPRPVQPWLSLFVLGVLSVETS